MALAPYHEVYCCVAFGHAARLQVYSAELITAMLNYLEIPPRYVTVRAEAGVQTELIVWADFS
jgi:hypothetical protein